MAAGTPKIVAVTASPEIQARIRFAEATALLDQGESALREAIAELPQFTGASSCCESPEWQVITNCLAQWCRLDQDSLTASTNGWSDLGDMTGPEYVQCLTCSTVWQSPARLNWS